LEDISKLQNTLNLFWVDFVLKKFDTKEFSKLLELIEKHKAKQVLEKVILRTLSKAIYSAENEGHFWLGLDFYSHFTSPIRRYPDLQIHRIIKEKINWKLDKKRINHYKNILDNIWDVCSTQERKAEKLEYKVRDYYICKFYENRVWEEFEWVISGLIPKWFFVELSDTSEGFVSIPPLNPLLSKEGKMNKVSRGGFLYNEDLMQFEDRKNKKNYVLWDKVKVILKEVDLSELRLNFEILQEKNLT
jgi:ribonuclease R